MITYEDIIEEFKDKLPSQDEFDSLGSKTALFTTEENEIIKLNFNRGILLYYLIAKYQPKNVLEFGTARGFSTLCMAKAMLDFEIEGKIYTIDVIPFEKEQKYPIDWGDGQGSKEELISNKKLWEKISKKEILEHIITLKGYSGEVMHKHKFPPIDFCYIDGAHFYKGVKHDFYSFLDVASSKFLILFDDYIERKFFGVKKLVDEEIEGKINTKLIKTDTENYVMKLGWTNNERYGMCLVDNYDKKEPIEHIFPKIQRDNFLNKYRKYERRLKMRNNINEKVPFLKISGSSGGGRVI